MQCVFGRTAAFDQPHALTIGNFDGVHRGHQAVIAQALRSAEARDLPLTVLIFEPQPREFFARQRGQVPPARLMGLRDKCEALATAGVHRLWCLPFAQVQAMAAQRFVADLLEEKRVHHVIVGDDFRFGADRLGDYQFLTAHAERTQMSVERCLTFTEGGQRISSSRIREALSRGDLALAETLLGRPYQITGRVVHGRQLGRTLGFPTANVLLRFRPPLQGVYACEVELPSGQRHTAVANVGTRPTASDGRVWLEVHLHDFDQPLYGQRITVRPQFFIRPEQRFADLAALSSQIACDSATARHLLTHA